MQFALINGIRTEAYKGAKGICPLCSSSVIAKCGDKNINHWSHIGKRMCDKWWEHETDWHRNWKENFPVNWREVIHFDEKGEKHIADVKTDNGLVLEFQHSYIQSDELNSRNIFYKRIAWVVDGLRRVNDQPGFFKVIKESTLIRQNNINAYAISFPEESRILKDWVNCGVPVLFDFYEPERLWIVMPNTTVKKTHIVLLSRNYFIEVVKSNLFESALNTISKAINDYNNLWDQIDRDMANRRINQFFHKSTAKKRRL